MLSVMLYLCMFCVALSMDLFCFVGCVSDSVCELFVKQFAISLGVVVILNVMEVWSVGGDALLDCVWYSKEYVCCACDSSVHLDVPSIGCVWVCLKSFRSWRAESQVFALLTLFLCVILHTMWSDKSLQLICILAFGILCLSAIRMIFVKILLAVCMLMGIVV